MKTPTLQEYCERARARFRPSYTSPAWGDSEELAWSVMDWLSSFEPTPADVAFLRATAPELLELLDDDDGASAKAPAPDPTPAAPAAPSVDRVDVVAADTGRAFARFPSFPTTAAALRFLAGVVFCCEAVATLYGPDGATLGRWRYAPGAGPGRRIR